MKKAFYYFVLYRLLDIESILFGVLDKVRYWRASMAAEIGAISK